jgi:SAM-dependent methyltransferase
MIEPYTLRNGIWSPPVPVAHREEEYDSHGFDILERMQRDHFWFLGRHRFLLQAVRRHLGNPSAGAALPRVVDLGGGCGGWLGYLLRTGYPMGEVALADSSEVALNQAARLLPEGVGRYQVDLLRLQWEERWDLAFLLDVLEHIPEQEEALRQIHAALAPGGMLFITVPALNIFWSWNDEIAHHQRRYRLIDFRRLADECGYQHVDARYFMFFLSPLLLASRLAASGRYREMQPEQRMQLMARMHRVPNAAANGILAKIFGWETPIGHSIRFPWGTSLLAVLRKPS